MNENIVTDSAILTSDTLVKGSPGRVRSITIAYKGVAAGDFVNLRDGLTVAGSVKAMFVFPGVTGTTVNGNIKKEWVAGKKFATGIFFNVGAGGGSVWAEVEYE